MVTVVWKWHPILGTTPMKSLRLYTLPLNLGGLTDTWQIEYSGIHAA